MLTTLAVNVALVALFMTALATETVDEAMVDADEVAFVAVEEVLEDDDVAEVDVAAEVDGVAFGTVKEATDPHPVPTELTA